MDKLLTIDSILTLSGATGATFVVTNGLKQAFNLSPRWIGLAIAQVIMIAGAYYASAKGSDYLLAIVNGFLIYCSAAGFTGASNAIVGGAAAGGATPAAGRGNTPDEPLGTRTETRFLTPWF